MHLLPNNLGSVADIAAKQDTKYALTAVCVSCPNDAYKVMASNGRSLIIVEGNCDDTSTFPSVADLSDRLSAPASSLIPAATWKDVFSKASSLTKRSAKYILRNVAIFFGAHNTALACTDIDSTHTTLATNVEGRFPPCDSVIPTGEPKATFSVDAELLVELLSAIIPFAHIDCRPQVSFEVREPGKAIVIRAKTDRQTITAAIMPLIEQ